MKSIMNRRRFIKKTLIAAGSAPLVRYLAAPAILSAREPSDVLRCVQIGCGGRGATHLNEAVSVSGQRLVAMVDPKGAYRIEKGEKFA